MIQSHLWWRHFILFCWGGQDISDPSVLSFVFTSVPKQRYADEFVTADWFYV